MKLYNENILKGFFRYIILGYLISYFKVSDVSKMSWDEIFIAMYLNFSFNLMSGTVLATIYIVFSATYHFLNAKIKKK